MPHKRAKLLFKFGFILLFFLTILSQINTLNLKNERSKRALPLLFTNTSAITFICGFGVPVHYLNPELVTMGMVLKAQQFLPTTYQALKHLSSHHIERKSLIGRENDTLAKYRVFIYKALEQLSISLGQSGRTCVLKMICEATTIPFHHENGVLGELIHILLTPSTSDDIYATSADYEYLNAEKLGRSGSSCEMLYPACKESILERVTNVFE